MPALSADRGMQGRRIRVVPLSVAALCWSALVLQLALMVKSAGVAALPATLADFFGYFTILTNLFLALVCSAGSVHREGARAAGWYRPQLVGCASTAIVLVGATYHVLLRELWSPQGAQWLADVLLHYAAPLAGLFHWLWFAPRHRDVPAWAPLAWCAYPVGYFFYMLVRGAWLHVYPYPFIDPSRLGWPLLARNAVAMLVVFVVLGFALRGLAALLRRALSRET